MVNLPPVLWLRISPTFSMPALNARFLPQVEWFHSTFGPSTVCALAESGIATAIAAVSAESAPNPHSVPPYDALLPALSWFALGVLQIVAASTTALREALRSRSLATRVAAAELAAGTHASLVLSLSKDGPQIANAVVRHARRRWAARRAVAKSLHTSTFREHDASLMPMFAGVRAHASSEATSWSSVHAYRT